MSETWYQIDLDAVVGIIVSTIFVYIALVFYTRLLGVRSFSKISSFDYAVTIAFGSILASVAMSPNPSIIKGVLTMGLLFTIQWLVSEVRRKSDQFEAFVDNKPVLLIANGELLVDNLAKAKVTKYDVYSKLRFNGHAHYDDIFAMIMETTGDIAIIEKGVDHINWDVFEELDDLHLLKRE